MRQNRSKAYRKLMAMYSTSFGFRQPYQVLGACVAIWQRAIHLLRVDLSVDSEMCGTAASQKIDLVTRMETVLVGSVKISE